MALVKPTLTFELGLTAGFRDTLASVSWTDITNYVIAWSTGRGREPKKPPSHFDPGVANLTLNNRDRRFDPTNTAGPYSPNLKPARVRLRIRATYLAVTYDVFTGYVKRWPPEWTATATSTVKITAVDALGAPLNLAQIYASLWETVVRHDKPKVWLRLDDGSGTVAADATANRLDGQYQGTPTLGQPSLVGTDSAGKSARFVTGSRASLPYKNLLSGWPFTVEFWLTCDATLPQDRVIFSAYDGAAAPIHQFIDCYVGFSGSEAGRVVTRISNPSGTGTYTQVNTSVLVNDGARHHVVWVANTNVDSKVYVDGVDVSVVVNATANLFPNDLGPGYGIGNVPAVAFGDFAYGLTANDLLDEVVIYDTALSAARISKHYAGGVGYAGLLRSSGAHVVRLLEEADWPADYDVDTGESLLQTLTTSGSVVANLQKIEDSEQGALFVDESGDVIFQDRHAMTRAPYNASQVTLEQGVGTLVYEPPVLWGNDDAELFNVVSGSRVGGTTYTVSDADSVDEYGERPLSAVTGLWNVDDGEVVDLLTYRVDRYSQPVSSLRQVRLHPAAVPDLYPYVLGLGLRSRITAKVAPPGGGPVFSQESHIERISHEVDDKGDWWTTWDISAADTTNYFVLDDLARGVLDADNRLAL